MVHPGSLDDDLVHILALPFIIATADQLCNSEAATLLQQGGAEAMPRAKHCEPGGI